MGKLIVLLLGCCPVIKKLLVSPPEADYRRLTF